MKHPRGSVVAVVVESLHHLGVVAPPSAACAKVAVAGQHFHVPLMESAAQPCTAAGVQDCCWMNAPMWRGGCSSWHVAESWSLHVKVVACSVAWCPKDGCLWAADRGRGAASEACSSKITKLFGKLLPQSRRHRISVCNACVYVIAQSMGLAVGVHCAATIRKCSTIGVHL